MKILFLQFPLEPAWGGAEEHTFLLVKMLKAQGHQVALFSNNTNLCTEFHKSNIPASCVFLGWEPTAWWSLFLFPFTALWASIYLLFILLYHRPDVVFCLSLTDKLAATWLMWILRTKKIIWNEHTRVGRWLSANPLLFFYRLESKWATIIAPSYFLRNQLVDIGIKYEKIKIIYPAIFCPQAAGEELLKDNKGVVLGYLGRLTKEKGVDDLLQAVSSIKRDGLQLMVAGSGPEELSLRRLTKKLGLIHRVSFLGQIKNKATFFNQISVLVIPSRLPESFGLVAIEAMCAGVPVVASRAGGLMEIVQHNKTGLLYNPGDIEGLTDAIKLLESNQHLRSLLSVRAYRAVMDRFSLDKMMNEFSRLLY